jgi:hypothetical protein
VAGIESDEGGFYVRDAMAGALVFARLKPANGSPHAAADALRLKVRNAIAAEIAIPLGSATDTRPGRHIGGWPIVADLINLPAYDPALESAFRAWLNRAQDHVWSNGQSMRTLRGQHMHNRGAMARFSSAAVACYTRSSAEVGAVAQLMRRFYGDTGISVSGESTPFSEPAGDGSGDTWQVQQPVSQSTRVGVGAAGATRDGNRFDGLMPGDIYRGLPSQYDADNFPPSANGTSYSYVEVTSYAHLGALHMLNRCGHRDLVTYQSSAQLRSLQWLLWAATNYADRDWSYFGLGRGSAQEAAMPLARYLYPNANLPATRTRTQRAGANYGFGWTWWLFGGRSL